VKRKANKAMLCPFYCKERCGEHFLGRGKGARDRGGHAFLCLLLTFLDKKEDKREKEGVKRMGRKAILRP